MSHYFTNDDKLKSQPVKLVFDHAQHRFHFISDAGIFSKNHIDHATQLLLKHLDIAPHQKVLDLGCGYGVIGIVLAKLHKAYVTMSDVNRRALVLAQENARINKTDIKLLESDGFTHIKDTFDHIVSNPPIRIGKTHLQTLYEEAMHHLNVSGRLWLVIHKKHGALSTMRFLETLGEVNLIHRSKGIHVICVRKIN